MKLKQNTRDVLFAAQLLGGLLIALVIVGLVSGL